MFAVKKPRAEFIWGKNQQDKKIVWADYLIHPFVTFSTLPERNIAPIICRRAESH